MKLELVVVFFPPNLAISRALNRVSKIEAVIMSHDPAKNNSTDLMWLLSCQAGQVPGLWGPTSSQVPEGLPDAPFHPPPPHQEPTLLPAPSPLPPTATIPAQTSVSSLLSSHSENPSPGQHRRLGGGGARKHPGLSRAWLCALGQVALPPCPSSHTENEGSCPCPKGSYEGRTELDAGSLECWVSGAQHHSSESAGPALGGCPMRRPLAQCLPEGCCYGRWAEPHSLTCNRLPRALPPSSEMLAHPRLSD